MAYEQLRGGPGVGSTNTRQGGQGTGTSRTGGPVGEGTGQQLGLGLEDALSGEMRLALHDFIQSAMVCEWCADQCLDEGPEMAECVRLCRDVTDLAMQNVRFISRDSSYGPDIAETFAAAAEECARECANHPHKHCQECASTLRRAVDSTWNLLESIGHRPDGPAPRQVR